MKQYLRKAGVAKRYGIDPRSVDRWLADGKIPKPIHKGRVPLWDVDALDACDRAATATTARPKASNAATA